MYSMKNSQYTMISIRLCIVHAATIVGVTRGAKSRWRYRSGLASRCATSHRSGAATKPCRGTSSLLAAAPPSLAVGAGHSVRPGNGRLLPPRTPAPSPPARPVPPASRAPGILNACYRCSYGIAVHTAAYCGILRHTAAYYKMCSCVNYALYFEWNIC